MTFRGRLKGIRKDWQTNTPIVALTLENGAICALNDLSDKDLSIEIKPYKQKRSLEANSYLWILCSKLADKLQTSKEEVYETMLQRYGCFYEDENGYITITVKSEVDMSKIEGHWKYIKEVNGFKSYLMIKGTSQYDTREMAHFLDAVVEECKEMGIETLPPDEIERMKATWRKD